MLKGSWLCLAACRQFLQKVTCCPASARVGDHAYPNALVAVECSACRAALVASLSMAFSSVYRIKISAPAGESRKAWHRLKILCATSLDRKTSLYFSTACLFFKCRPLALSAVGAKYHMYHLVYNNRLSTSIMEIHKLTK